ncbi:integrase core domain-containing protein [Streptomyces sp. NPDC001415]
MSLRQRDRDGRSPVAGELVHHSDAGSQYTSFRLAEHLDAAQIAASIGSVGDAYDNALMESTIGLLKTEVIKPQRPWKTLSHVELATTERIDWYNHRRLHGEKGAHPARRMRSQLLPINRETPGHSQHLRSLSSPERFTGCRAGSRGGAGSGGRAVRGGPPGARRATE